jgi:tRNA1(Val) A37 N6-methylase TrmN6
MPVQLDPEEYEGHILLDFTGSLAGKRVLEIGAGNGRLTWRYADRAAHVTALEPDPARHRAAVDDLPETLRDRLVFHPISIEQYEPDAKSPGFDVAIMSWSL